MVSGTETLGQAFGFSADDLASNRQGQLSAGQHARLSLQQQRALRWGGLAFIGFALLATIFLYMGSSNPDQGAGIAVLVGMFITVLNAISVGMVGRHYMRLRADLSSAALEVLRGPLERVLRPDSRFNNYALRIQGVELAVTKEQFKLFSHQAHYALYRTPHTRQLLSAELLKGEG